MIGKHTPAFNQLWRYVGHDRGHGTVHRILRCTWREIGTVQESPVPDWSWLGAPEDFIKVFVFEREAGEYSGRNGNGFNMFGW